MYQNQRMPREVEEENFDILVEMFQELPPAHCEIGWNFVWIDDSVELNEKIAMLSAANGTEIGPSIVLPVKRGDKVSLRTDYFYSQDDQAETYDNFGLLVNEVLLALASSGAGVLQLSEAQLLDIATGSGNYGQAVSNFMSSNFDTTDVTKPHAYLIWVLYDNTMRLVPEGSGVLRVTDPNALERLLQEEIPIVGDGYLHAYVANKSSKPLSFDNILITLQRGNTRQINHYYPYGLSISGIGGDYDEYLNKYTGKELQTGEFDPNVSTGLEMFDFHARFYDPQIGRWFTPDPAEQFANPYLAMANNPVRYTDPTGTYVPMRYWLGGDGGDGGGGGGGGSGSNFGYNTQNSGNPWMLTSSSWANDFRTEEYNRAFLSLNAQNAMYGPQIPRYYLGNKVSYNATKGGYGYWNDHNEYTTDGVVSEKYGTTQGILFPVSEWVSLDFGDFSGEAGNSLAAISFVGGAVAKRIDKIIVRNFHGNNPMSIIRTPKPFPNIRVSTATLNTTGKILKVAGPLAGVAGLYLTLNQFDNNKISGTEATVDAVFGIIGFFVYPGQ